MKRLIVALGVVMMTTGCVSTKEYNKVIKENQYLGDQLTHYRNSTKRMETQLAAALGIADNHEDTEKTLRLWIAELEGMVKDKPAINMVKGDKENTVVFRVENTLLFAPGSIEISKKGMEEIASLAEKLKTAPGLIRIDGHTDNQPVKSAAARGIAADNMELSVKRALAVRSVLVSEGVAENKIFVSGFGQFQPIAKNTAKGNSKNRRVDIVWMPEAKTVNVENSVLVSSKRETTKEPKETTQKLEETKTQEK